MNNTYNIKTKTWVDVISLAQAKLYLRVDYDDDDTLISSLIKSAVYSAEKFMNRDILTTVWENYRDTVNLQDMTLRRGGFISLSQFQYLSDGSYVTIDADDYQVASKGIFGKIYTASVPSHDEHPEAIRIEFTTGFATVPEDIKTGLLSHIASMYENRGDCPDIPACAMELYKGYKIVEI